MCSTAQTWYAETVIDVDVVHNISIKERVKARTSAPLNDASSFGRHAKMRSLVPLLCLLSSLATCAHAELQLPASVSVACAAGTEYYDETMLGCRRCAVGSDTSTLVVDTTHTNAFGLPTSCTCKAGTIAVAQDDAVCASTWPAPCSVQSCKSCPTGQVPTRDASRCLPCGTTTLGAGSTTECRCVDPAAILVEQSETHEFLAAKACVRCANGTRPNAARSACEPCFDPSMAVVLVDGSYQCRCDSSTHELVTSDRLNATKCVKRSHMNVLNAKVSLSAAATVTYADVRTSETGASSTALTLTSALFQDVFVLAASECYFYQTEQQSRFCQTLGNLCVLQHFAPTAAACAFLDLVQRGGRTAATNGVAGWYNTLPFLTYSASTRSVLESTAIGMTMSFDEVAAASTSDHLEFVLVTYDVSGALTIATRLTTQLLYCLPETPSLGTPRWTRFGVSATQQYTCDLSILDASKLELYELYVVDRSKSEGDAGRLVPVPVQNLNYKDAKGFALNANRQPSDVADDVLTHRFFLYDFVSGIAADERRPRVYRYAETITLTIRTQKTNVQRIYSPVLSIAYVDTQTLRNATVQLHVTYASDTTAFWTTALALFLVANGLAFGRVVLQTYTWQRRSTRNEELGAAMWHSMAHLATCSAANGARASFVVLFALTTYFLLFFKLQSTVFVLLPEVTYDTLATSMDEYYPFRVLLPLALALQLAFVLHTVYAQTQALVLFIDWEKPRATVLNADDATPQSVPVSIWRTILVANEWNALQVARRTSFELTLVALLFLLYGCDVRSAATAIPRAQMAHMGDTSQLADAQLELNPYLRFAIVSGLWLLLCTTQRLANWLVLERYVTEPRECLFVDLCTVAKVSCLVLDEPYHGFYLHCRSPYPFADGNMSEIVAQLKQEEAGLTVGRGLDSGLPDCQAFEMFVTRRWKRKFQTCVAAVYGDGGSGAAGKASVHNNGSELLRRHRPFAQHTTNRKSTAGTVATQTMVTHAAMLSDFVKAFVENADEQYRWRIYRAQTCLGSYFGIPPEITSSKQSLFLPDTTSKWAKVLFLGIENDLMLLNILCFCAFDLWTESHAVAALSTYVLEHTLVALRRHFGSKQLARSTLIDPRFFF